MNIGVIGVGNISGIYLNNLSRSSHAQIIAVADIDCERAQLVAARYQIPTACTVEEILDNPQVDVILNLTTPQSHIPLALQAVAKHKHVYSEKPLGLDLESAEKLLQLAKQAHVEVGSAPDTFLGAAHQACRALIDDGVLGDIVGINGFMLSAGHESWHPNPEFYYLKGGGPMLDMGPYYITAMVNMLGPIAEVKSFARTTHPVRTITSHPKSGQQIVVETHTHIEAIFQFHSGVIGHLATSFDVPVHNMPSLVVYGSKGTLIVPDPNGFGGVPKLRLAGQDRWEEIVIERPYSENSRGIGLLEFIDAIKNKREPVVSGKLALHVLEVMLASIENLDHSYKMTSTVEKPNLIENSNFFDRPAADWDN